MKTLVCLLLVALAGCATTPRPLPRIPVMIASSGVDDPCGGVAVVIDDNGKQNSIRTRPEYTAERVVSVAPGRRLLLCETSGDWYGVVVLKKDINCLSSDYGLELRAYAGPCDYGWIEQAAVEFIAG